MKKSFRDFLGDLEAAGELGRYRAPVDMRDVSALCAQSRQASLFERLKDYPGWRLAGALLTSGKRLALAMGCAENEVARRSEEGLGRLVAPVIVEDAPCQQIVLTGDAVDLAAIPYPLIRLPTCASITSGASTRVSRWRLRSRSPV
jgi:4-hydroxy-3-polyprenylbenzoate decarboxylase